MAKMINVDELIEFCNTERAMLHAHNNSVACAALRRVAEFAKENAVEVEPVKHGRWERRMAKIYACSECTNEVTDRQRQNYSFCPYCGALMDVAYKDDKIRAIKVVGWDGGGE